MWFVLGNPLSRRVELFQQALSQWGEPAAEVLSWADLLRGSLRLPAGLDNGAYLRLESPGRDAEVEDLLIRWGGGEPPAIPQKGLLWQTRQWYAGLVRALEELRGQLQGRTVRLSHPPETVAALFDKSLTQARLQACSIAIPEPLGMVQFSPDPALAQQVFFKFAHGSSAVGAVAYRSNGRQVSAWTTAEQAGEQLFSTRRIRHLNQAWQVQELLRRLIPHGLWSERWIPKSSFPGVGAFDVRVLTIGSQPAHVVGRAGAAMTNLHLLNQRVDGERLRQHLGNDAWTSLMATAGRVAREAFPECWHLGIDLAFPVGRSHPVVLEVNAFGDLLPGILHDRLSTHAAQVGWLLGRTR